MIRLAAPLLSALRPRANRIAFSVPEFAAAAGEGWLDRIMTERITDKLHEKQGRSIARWTLQKSDGSRLAIFLKRHYRLPWWQGVMARLLPGRAWSPGLQEWEHLQWASAAGVPVPRPLAAAEWRKPGFRLQSFLAIEELAGMLPLHEAVPLARERLNANDFLTWKRRIINELVRLTCLLHGRNAFHKDLYLCHFYLSERCCHLLPETFENQVVAIDFHRLARHSWLTRYFQAKDLAQLLYSTVAVNGIDDRDRFRFWHRYQWLQDAPSWIRIVIRWKYSLYLRHAHRKRARRLRG